MSVTYSANGNIASKTGIGSYTYSSSSKPHAVTEVQNIGGLIDMNTQELGFNGWNRLTSVWQTDDHNFYSYSIDYGPDLKRVTSEMHKTYQKQYEKFYWDDYEEKYVGNDTLRYWYIYTPGGLEGLYIEKSTPNGMTSHTTKVITDHLGSIESLIDNGDWVYDVSYDAWGKREVLLPYWFDPTFDRGYCGHEHIDELGLINMNGRMYDPLLGRFLSPDPYVQSPTNPQNYNRYSYCLNNPLKYTDPNGEIVWLPIIIGAAMGGYGGYKIAESKGYDIGDLQTYGYILGGAAIGGISGILGASAAGGGLMANTASIMVGSSASSLGMSVLSGGMIAPNVSFGVLSLDFGTKTIHSFNKANSALQNLGYAFGLIGNIGDLLMLGQDIGEIDLVTDPTGDTHSAIVNKGSIGEKSKREYYNTQEQTMKLTGRFMDEEKIISVGPYQTDLRSWLWKKGHNQWNTHAGDKGVWRETITLNRSHLYRYASFLDDLEQSGRLIYSAPLSSCVTHTSIALNLSGVLNIGLHPILLHAQMYLRNLGIRPSLYSYYMLK